MLCVKNIMSRIIQTIHSQAFAQSHKLKEHFFSRQRKLSFAMVLTTLLQRITKSLQIECNLLADLFKQEPVSKQALSKARYKIGVSAFQELHQQALADHYQDNNLRLWKGFRVFGGDGSTLQLPNQGDIPACFGKHFKYTTLARIFQYTELTSDIVVSTAMLPYSCSENAMAKMQLPELVETMHGWGQSKLLFVYDRGFRSHEFTQLHRKLGVDFLLGVPRNFHPEIAKRIASKQEDDFILEVSHGKKTYSYRVLILRRQSGEAFPLLTSLMNKSVYSPEDLAEAYGLRWRCEESYKFQKLTLEMENFSAKTAQGVWQEYWATVLLASLMAMLFNEEEEQINDPQMKINRSVVFGTLKRKLMMTLMQDLSWDAFYTRFAQLCRRHRVRKRPNRSYPRLSFDVRKTRHIYRRCL